MEKLIDAHIHVGQFNDIYTSPQEVVSFMQQAEVEKYAVMSTTIWTEDYEKVLHEMRELVLLAPQSTFPILWLTPQMLYKGKLEMMLESGIQWYALKVHGNHPWSLNGVNECANIAEELQLPLILHSGGFQHCEAGVYKDIVKSHPNTTFVLAHCRPVDQAIGVMKECPNCYGDTAYTPLADIAKLISAGLEDQILFGTDYPMQKIHAPEKDLLADYKETTCYVRDVMSYEQWEKVSHINFEKLYNLLDRYHERDT